MEHLDTCESCTRAATEANSINSRLALGLLPLFLGAAGATAYANWTTLVGQCGRIRTPASAEPRRAHASTSF